MTSIFPITLCSNGFSVDSSSADVAVPAGGIGSHDDVDPGRHGREAPGHDGPEPALDPGPDDGPTDGLGHHETDPRRESRSRVGPGGVHHEES